MIFHLEKTTVANLILGTPSQVSPPEIMNYRRTLHYVLYIIGKYNSDQGVLEHTSTPQITITLVAHPRSEDHGLTIIRKDYVILVMLIFRSMGILVTVW